jgi:DHA2 family multidrug resistance protein-like MFS transporter
MMAALDSTIANVALPTIGHDLHASAAASIWIVNAYQISVVTCLLPLSGLGEIVGFRRVYQAGVTVFTLSSLAVSVAPTIELLCVARMLQGLGAAGIMSVGGALTRFAYPKAQLGRAVSITAMIVAVSSALGPTVASGILALGEWRWLFGVNIPFGILSLSVGWRSLPVAPQHPRKYDWIAAALLGCGVGLTVAGPEAFSRAGGHGTAALQITAGLALIALMVRRGRGLPHPLVPIDLLRIPLFRRSLAISILAFSAQMLALVSLPFDIQHRLGFDPVETGLLMTPWPIAVAAMAPIAGRLADRFPAAVLGAGGMAMLSIGIASLAIVAPNSGPATFIVRMALCGLGFGLFQSPSNRLMLASAPIARAGAAGGMQGTARLLGQSLGAMGVAICFHLAADRATVWALACGSLVSAAAAALSLSRLAREKAQRMAN